MTELRELARASASLAEHPQDHGWREFYRRISGMLDREDESLPLNALVAEFCEQRVESSPTHTITLIGIAFKQAMADDFPKVMPADDRVQIEQRLDHAALVYRDALMSTLLTRRNSFTGARRFLVPQVLLGAFVRAFQGPLLFSDLGTGLGLLTRQIQSPANFAAYARDLRWPGEQPVYTSLPLLKSLGVERGPIPDSTWVHACYGQSDYYKSLYEELSAASMLADNDGVAKAKILEGDLLDFDRLATLIRGESINCANLSYVLYEMPLKSRQLVVDTVLSALSKPYILIIAEPNGELGQPGCSIHVYASGSSAALHVCNVSDGHFNGFVEPGPDYDEFVARFPIKFESPREPQRR